MSTNPKDDPPKVLTMMVLKSVPWGRRRGEIVTEPLTRCECGRQHIPQSGRWCPCGAALPFEVYRRAS